MRPRFDFGLNLAGGGAVKIAQQVHGLKVPALGDSIGVFDIHRKHLLSLTILRYGEIFRLKIPDEIALPIPHLDINQHQFRVGLQGEHFVVRYLRRVLRSSGGHQDRRT